MTEPVWDVVLVGGPFDGQPMRVRDHAWERVCRKGIHCAEPTGLGAFEPYRDGEHAPEIPPIYEYQLELVGGDVVRDSEGRVRFVLAGSIF